MGKMLLLISSLNLSLPFMPVVSHPSTFNAAKSLALPSQWTLSGRLLSLGAFSFPDQISPVSSLDKSSSSLSLLVVHKVPSMSFPNKPKPALLSHRVCSQTFPTLLSILRSLISQSLQAILPLIITPQPCSWRASEAAVHYFCLAYPALVPRNYTLRPPSEPLGTACISRYVILSSSIKETEFPRKNKICDLETSLMCFNRL